MAFRLPPAMQARIARGVVLREANQNLYDCQWQSYHNSDPHKLKFEAPGMMEQRVMTNRALSVRGGGEYRIGMGSGKV